MPQNHLDSLRHLEDTSALFASEWLERIGSNIHNHKMQLVIHDALIIGIILLFSALIYIVVSRYISKLILKLIGKTKTHWDDILYNEHFFAKITYLIPPIAIRFALANIDLNHDKLISEII